MSESRAEWVTEQAYVLRDVFDIISPLDPERVVAALIAAGWSVAGKREGAYVRLVGPGESIGCGRSLLVPLNPENADHQELMDAALMELVGDVRRGRAAMRVLYSLRGVSGREELIQEF